MAPMSTKSKWARANDWETHRNYITDLYLKKQMTLSMVMQVMRDKHGFNATIKQYKNRFTDWGVKKNSKYKKRSTQIKHEQIVDFDIPEISSSIQLALPEAHVKQHQKFMPSPPMVLQSCRRSSSNPSISSLFSLPTPGVVRLPEECMHNIKEYITRQFAMGAWTSMPDAHTLHNGRKLRHWAETFTAGARLVYHGKRKEGMRLFERCSDHMATLIEAQNWALLPVVSLAATGLWQLDPGFGRSVMVRAARLCRIIFGTTFHLLGAAFSQLARMSQEEFIQSIGHLVDFYWDTFEANLASPHNFVVTTVDNLRSLKLVVLANCGLLDSQVGTYSIGKLALRQKRMEIQAAAPGSELQLHLRTNTDLAAILFSNNQLQETTDIATEVLAEPRLRPSQHTGAHMLLFAVAHVQGNVERALQRMEDFIAHCHASLGANKHIMDTRMDLVAAGSAMVQLEGGLVAQLHRAGYVDVAEKYRRAFNADMEDLCRNFNEAMGRNLR